MGTTSNYSWPYPASTDPVADGAQNIEDLATDADTTVRGIELATVMRFADAAARSAALSGIEIEGMLTFLQDTDALEYYDGSAWQGVGGTSMIKKVEAFTASGSWTVPAGVTYAVAHILGGGGGGGAGASYSNGSTGGTSSVAFASGTVSALGGKGGLGNNSSRAEGAAIGAGSANSGRGGPGSAFTGGNAYDAQWVVAGAAVTPAASITVTVGAGGAAGNANAADGGSGYVWIEYYEEA